MQLKPLVLGIEGTAHSLGFGVATLERVSSSVVSTYTPETGGIHPREAAEFISQEFSRGFQKTLEFEEIKPEDIDCIAFSRGPGLSPCLRVTATASRSLSLALKVPLIGVNHCVAHIEIAKRFTGLTDPLILYCSGGNTQIIFLDTTTSHSRPRYRIVGETIDIAIGNALDMIARELGIGHPGGPVIESLASKGSEYINLPYVVKGMSLSFSGFVTAAEKASKKGIRKEDLCFSIQETAFAMLAEVVDRALGCTQKQELLVTGGVAANKRLQEMLETIGDERGVEFKPVPSEYAGDNGAMIAWTGLLQQKYGENLLVTESQVLPRWRTDEVDITWAETSMTKN